MDNFDDIRPFRDDEVNSVLRRIISDKGFLNAMLLFRFPTMPAWLLGFTRPLLRLLLTLRTRRIHSIRDFQLRVKKLMDQAIKNSTTSLTSSGLEQLDLSQPHLFISNHRDIALDPAFVNYILHINGQDTVQIAIGDNLLTTPWSSDIMRLNRSFVVKRSASSKREKLMQSKQLSAYIKHALTEQGDHIWIAQREGRAKDGIDRTNSAIISMLALNKDKQTSLSDYLRQLRIVPVSIAYEYDPCDIDKATEVCALEKHGAYEKQDGEDMRSISKGILGQKGRVHLNFGLPLQDEYADAKAVAEAIDQHIISHYQVMDTNLVADAMLSGADTSSLPEQAKWYIKTKLANEPEDVGQQVLAMYANPIRQKNSLQAQQGIQT